jgi:hypothetical protein
MSPSILFAQEMVAVDGDVHSAAAIIAVAGAFVLAIVFVICVTTTIQRVFTVRASNELIMDLVNKGFSADEIERIAYGKSKIGTKVGRFFRDARNAFRKDQSVGGNPVPPVKAAG